MRIDTKYDLEQEVYVAYNGNIYRGYVSELRVSHNLKDFYIEYLVEMFRYDNNQSEPDMTMWMDQNHVFNDKYGIDMQIELALQHKAYKEQEK